MKLPRWIALLLLFCCASPGGAEPAGSAFYYLAIPSAPAKCLFFSCLRFDAQGKPGAEGKKSFTLWRSGYWDEREPDIVVKNAGDWTHALELRARKAVVARPEMGRMPPGLIEIFVALETLREAALNTPIVAEPLFRNPNFVGWENARQLNAIAVPDTLGPTVRQKALLQSMGALEKEQGQDPGPWLKGLLASLGTKVESARYYPEYNAFVFVAGADFPETMETLFSATTGH
jgi:hypothetical protein